MLWGTIHRLTFVRMSTIWCDIVLACYWKVKLGGDAEESPFFVLCHALFFEYYSYHGSLSGVAQLSGAPLQSPTMRSLQQTNIGLPLTLQI